MFYFDQGTLCRLDRAKLARHVPVRRNRLWLTVRVAAVTMAINYFLARGRTDATAAEIRAVLELVGATGLPPGNEFLGNMMGAKGFGFMPVDSTLPKRFALPAEITRELIEERFLVPDHWDWDREINWADPDSEEADSELPEAQPAVIGGLA